MTAVMVSNVPNHGDRRKVMMGDTMVRAVYLVE
jgi:hypothetical protein